LPQDPTTTPDTELRIAQHPDHISDVRMALRFLTENYGLSAEDGGERVEHGNAYVLIGHSAGATLAFQLFMAEDTLCGCIPQPAAVIGISGIYDLVGLDDRHTGYTSFISSAFGDSKENWKRASPATYPCSFAGRWTADKPTILAWSAEDSLIDEPEIDAMSARLSQDGIQASVIKDLTGEHDDVWREGSQIHRLVQLVIGDLQQGRNTRLIT
jgi:kynurenine formamidase